MNRLVAGTTAGDNGDRTDPSTEIVQGQHEFDE